MNLWLACFFLLLFTVEGLQWLGTFDWVAVDQWPLPLMIAGGVSLAIASNRSHHQESKPATPKSSVSKPTEPLQQLSIPSQVESFSPPKEARSPSKRSISFEIRRAQKHGETRTWRPEDPGRADSLSQENP